MRIDHLSPVLPVEDMAAAVTFWQIVLGAEPKVVDGRRWAQFEIGGRRLSLAGTDRVSEQAGVMIKVDDLEQARERAQAAGGVPGAIEEGAHELRFTATAPGGWPITCYAAKP